MARSAGPREEREVWRPSGLPGVELSRLRGARRGQPPHFHDEYELSVHLGGAQEVALRGAAVHPVAAGRLWVVGPREVHAWRPERGACLQVLQLRLSAPLLAGACGWRGEGGPSFAAGALEDEALGADLVRLHEALGRRQGRPEAQRAQLEAFLARLRPHARAAGPPAPPRPAVQRARDHLREHLRDNVSLEALAALVALSKYHLARLFQREVGLPPHAYQLQVRLQRACGLLARGLPAGEVARLTGFADQSHFTRAFRRWLGLTPTRYRAGCAGPPRQER